MQAQYIAFEAQTQVGGGDLEQTLTAAKQRIDNGSNPAAVLIFEVSTGRQRDFDFRGSLADVLDNALPPAPKRGRGRPRLGVTAREITLLPRHWSWLETQGKSPSATIRNLVEQAMRDDPKHTEGKPDAEALVRIMSAVGGNLPGFEEAVRSLYRSDHGAFKQQTAEWPDDLRRFLGRWIS